MEDEPDVPALKGWRYELFGAEAQRLKRGEVALKVANGEVVPVAVSAALPAARAPTPPSGASRDSPKHARFRRDAIGDFARRRTIELVGRRNPGRAFAADGPEDGAEKRHHQQACNDNHTHGSHPPGFEASAPKPMFTGARVKPS